MLNMSFELQSNKAIIQNTGYINCERPTFSAFPFP